MAHFVPAFCCHLRWPLHSHLHPAPQIHTGLFACLSSESLVPLRPARVLWGQPKGRKRNKLLPVHILIKGPEIQGTEGC